MDIRSTSIRFERGIKKIRVSLRLNIYCGQRLNQRRVTQTNPGSKVTKNRVSQLCKVGHGFAIGTFRNDRPLSYPQVGKGKGPRFFTNSPFSVDFWRHLSFPT